MSIVEKILNTLPSKIFLNQEKIFLIIVINAMELHYKKRLHQNLELFLLFTNIATDVTTHRVSRYHI